MKARVNQKPVIFFDLDETLIFAEGWLFGADPRIRIKSTLDRLQGSTDENKIRMARRYRQELEILNSSPVIRLSEHAIFSIRVFPGTIEEIRRAREVAELHVFTAADGTYAEAALHATGMRGYFDSVISLTEAEIDPQSSFPFLGDRPWVLIDDTPAKDKLKVLRSMNENGRLVQHEGMLSNSVDKALILLDQY